MSVDEEADLVEVLYDYSYEDEKGIVTIEVGDRYTLLEKTNHEWWHVERPPPDSESFFVPAQYVRIIPREDDAGIYSNRETFVRKDVNSCGDRTTPPVSENRRGSQDDDLTASQLDGARRPRDLSVQDDDRHLKQEVLYANLDDLRAGAGLPPLLVGDKQQACESCSLKIMKMALETGPIGPVSNAIFMVQLFEDSNLKWGRARSGFVWYAHQPCEYANLPMGPDGEGSIPPLPEEGDTGRRLVDYLPWFIHNEHGPGRPFYVNIETGERTYKPPRHKNQKIAEQLSPTFPKVNIESPGDVSPREVTIQTEYDEVKEDGKVIYVHKKTKDKYERTQNESGSQYFFDVKSGESFWELPSHSPRFPNGDTVDENRNRHQSHSLRMSKAKSMYEDMEYMKRGDPSQIKAHTLPPSFSYGSKMGTTNDSDSSEPRESVIPRPASPAVNKLDVNTTGGDNPRAESPVRVDKHETAQTSKARSTSPTFRFDDEMSGVLNKAKIADVGKKVKKTWSQSYVVLRGSNLVFYKDHKASMIKQGSPHGKPDFVLSLQKARLDFSQNSGVSSKKNLITLHVSDNTQFLLQSDEESTARKWFFRLKVAANDIQETKEQRHPGETQQYLRSQSVDDAGGAASADRHASFNATYFRIRDKLLSLISRRPTQEDLVKRGIIKDGVFGSHLQELCAKEHNTVPNFVKKCIAAVEHRGLDHDGLYRVSGNLAEIQKLRYVVDKEENYNLDNEDIDVHVLTGALKLFFRELKEPLFPFYMFDRFTDALKKEKNSARLRAFKDLMAELPRCNHDTMKLLFHHLKKVIDNSHHNRMQTQNVAIVFGPTLMWSDSDSVGMAVMTIMQSRVVEYSLLEFDHLFL